MIQSGSTGSLQGSIIATLDLEKRILLPLHQSRGKGLAKG